MAILAAMEAAKVRRIYVMTDWVNGRRVAQISTDDSDLPAVILATAAHVQSAAFSALDAEYHWAQEAIGYVEITSITSDIVIHTCLQSRI